MRNNFAQEIESLPRAAVPIPGARAFLSQADSHQVLFMEFEEDAILPEHSHESQWAVVVAGEIDLTIGGVNHTFRKGETYYIPGGTKHSGKIHAGYADVTFFNQKDRYGTV